MPRGLTGILLTQRAMTSPEPPEVFDDFWNGAYGAIVTADREQRLRCVMPIASHHNGTTSAKWLRRFERCGQPRRMRPRRAAKHIDMLTAPTSTIATTALASSSHSQPSTISERIPSSR